jgi:hypothetical protein
MKAVLLVTTAAVVILGAAALTRDSEDAHASSAADVLVSLGDTMQVANAPVGCRVTRLERYGSRIFLDCRRKGRLAGSYGAYFGEKDVLVVRFVGQRKAKTVLHARHEGGATRCT